jgi:FkbM family methyltransferase
MSTLRKAIKKYGWQGAVMYFKIKTGNTRNLRIPGIKNAVRLRRISDDVKLFKQLLIHEEYEFKSPVEAKFIIDAGANIGLSAVFFARKFPDAVLVAIEPEKENFRLLCDNTASYPNIKPINAGLWFKSTTLEVVDPAVGSTGFMVKETSSGSPNGFKAISVQEILQMYDQLYIDLFKIDIEGAEKELLSENSSWLSKSKMIIVELHDRKKTGCSQAFFNAFHGRNFECYPFGQNFLLFNKDLL